MTIERDPIIQRDLDNLADIIWWIKGYHMGAGDNYNPCPFGLDHIESLRKARVNLESIVMKETSDV